VSFIRTVTGDIDPDDLGVTYAPGHVLLGMDAARQGYYSVYGGAPGLDWLLRGFSDLMDEVRIGAADRHRLFVDNPARTFAFCGPHGGTE
jgi:predicted metal-dependent phosphotriesterase family hydrolase